MKLVSGAEIKYIGLNDTRINIVDNSSTEVQYTTDNIYEREGKYNIKVGGRYLYNNQTDGTREANHLGVDNNGGNRVTWGFIEVPDEEVREILVNPINQARQVYGLVDTEEPNFGDYVIVDQEEYNTIKGRLDSYNETETPANDAVELLEGLVAKKGIALYTTPYVYALKCTDANSKVGYLKLNDEVRNGSGNSLNAATFSENPETYFFIKSSDNATLPYYFEQYQKEERYLGVSVNGSPVNHWNVSNVDKSNWIIEPTAVGENTYYIKKGASGIVYLGHENGVVGYATDSYIYTNQAQGNNVK